MMKQVRGYAGGSVLLIAGLVLAPGALSAQRLNQPVVLPGAVCPKPPVPPDSIPPAASGAPADAAPALLSPRASDLLKGLPGGKGTQARLSFEVDVDGRMDPCTIRIVHDTDSTWTAAVLGRLAAARFAPARYRGEAIRLRVNQPYTGR